MSVFQSGRSNGNLESYLLRSLIAEGMKVPLTLFVLNTNQHISFQKAGSGSRFSE